MMSLSRIIRTPKRYDTSSQSSSSSLLTSTPVTGRPITTNEPAQSPIEQKNSSQTIITPERANPAPVRGRLGLSSLSLSLNETSNCRYRTRSQSRILEASLILDQSNTPKRNSKETESAVKIHTFALPSHPEGGKIGSENALSNEKKTGAMFSIFSKPNSTSPLTRSRTEVRGRQMTRTTDGKFSTSGNTRKTIIGNKESKHIKFILYMLLYICYSHYLSQYTISYYSLLMSLLMGSGLTYLERHILKLRNITKHPMTTLVLD